MWTIALYAWKGCTGSPESLWSADRVRFDADEGVEWWNGSLHSYKTDFEDYDIDVKNKIINIYNDEPPETNSTKEQITW